MRKAQIVLLLILLLAVITGSVFLFVGYFTPKGAGLFVDSVPTSDVFIDGEKMGRTPINVTKRPSEITVRLVPDSFNEPLSFYEQKVSLVSGVETIIRKTFAGESKFESSEILSFEKLSSSGAGLSVVTFPQGSKVILDSIPNGFTPYKNSSLIPGNYILELLLEGYVSKKLDIKLYEGYKLTAIVNLAEDPTYAVPPTPTPEQQVAAEETEVKVIVKILSTPVGFLRVRNEPSTLGTEVGQVEPDQLYEVLAEDEKTGWFKIEFLPAQAGEKGKQGWVSNQYVKVEEGDLTNTKTFVKNTPTP